ncbi:MAG TPA: hypothetical protein VGQ69_06215 [Gemmatimonadales bacterium]|nr:hypothetical protein [Gemmatimonadales bacterium]
MAIVFPVLIASGSCRAASTDRDYAVTGIDYAFQIPDTVRAGSAIVRFHNAGAVPHELAMALLKPGITVPRVLEVLKAGGSPDSLIDGVVGILIAQPGSDPMGRLAVNFQAGRTYALFCNFQDSPDKPPHSALGMVRSLDIPEPD